MHGRSTPSLIMSAIIAVLLIVITYLLVTNPARNAPVTPTLSKEDVKGIVKAYIDDNPDAIVASLQQMQARKAKEEEEEAKKTLEGKKGEIENRNLSPIAGNPEGDVAVVEFFDYRCGYCKKVSPVISQLLSEDKNVALILKELPILGPASEKATEVALAVYALDKSKYLQLHDALMASNDLNSEDAIIAKALALGIDKEQLKAQMAKPDNIAEAKRNHELATQLGIRGTPAFIVNGELIPGAADLATLKEKIADARNKKAKTSAK